MMTISYMSFKNSIRGKTLWRIACFTLIWMVWQERNVTIFEDNEGHMTHYGIYFISLLLCGPFVLTILRAFL